MVCIRAHSFPTGVMAAHNKLKMLLGEIEKPKIYGRSRPEKGQIVYYAAAEKESVNPESKSEFTDITLPCGTYVAVDIIDFMENISAIGNTFQKLLQKPDLDPNGYCVEYYNTDRDAWCGF